MSAFSVENPHDGKMFENYTRFEWDVEVGVVTIFVLRLFVPREFDMVKARNILISLKLQQAAGMLEQISTSYHYVRIFEDLMRYRKWRLKRKRWCTTTT